ncbi:MAG TPA: long-chain fatty acid--CoA ligase [Gemmatales bacterium]|nr:long-chain fatty acid--CoA ligase [Gemmatales bacterium]
MASFPNLAAMHLDVSERLGPRTALRHKLDGLYQDFSWNDYRRAVDELAAGLISLDMQAGDRVAIFSENRFEWLVTDVAILAAGCADVPLHASLVPGQAQYQIDHSQSRGIFVSTQAQADKILHILDALPLLEFIISFEPVRWDGVRIKHYTWAGLRQRGAQRGDAGRAAVRERIAQRTRADLATVIYTSGTTGNPKGVMLTHGNLLSNAEGMLKVSSLEPDDIQLSWLPYSHIYARTCDHYAPMMCGATVAVAENQETLLRNLAEIQPTWMTAVPRFYEKIWALVGPLPPEVRKQKLPALFGTRLKWLSSGGAALSATIAEGFKDCGIKLLQGYGLTETAPVISFNRKENFKLPSVGQMLPDVEVKIGADGEILTRGPHVMKGYWRNEAATAEVIDADGWFHTGDVGKLDEDGFLYITDRKKDLIVTSGGKNVAPAELERLLLTDPHLEHAVIYGDARPFVTAILVPNWPLVEKVCAEKGWQVQRDGEFVKCPPLHAFFQQRVEHLMQAVSQPERVKKFLMLGRPLSIQDDELTPKLSVRRKAIIAKWDKHFAKLYEPDEGKVTAP